MPRADDGPGVVVIALPRRRWYQVTRWVGRAMLEELNALQVDGSAVLRPTAHTGDGSLSAQFKRQREDDEALRVASVEVKRRYAAVTESLQARLEAVPDPNRDKKSGLWALVRTDFSSAKTWRQVLAEIVAGYPEDLAHGEATSPESALQHMWDIFPDRSLIGSTGETLAATTVRDYPDDYRYAAYFVADSHTMNDPGNPLAVVSKNPRDQARVFRCRPSQVWMIQGNLEIANMDFDEFAATLDEHGVLNI